MTTSTAQKQKQKQKQQTIRQTVDMKFHLICLVVVPRLLAANAFVVPTTITTTTMNPCKKGAFLFVVYAQKKSPRFSQEEHSNQSPSNNNNNNNNNDNTNKRIQKDNSPTTTNKKKTPPSDADNFFRRTTTATTTNNNNNNNKDPTKPIEAGNEYMWKSTKSIEELEATMTQRWGTTAQRWTADPNEYEFVNEKDNKVPALEFRGKPVVDPWLKEEQATAAAAATMTPSSSSTTAAAANGVFLGSKEDAVMNRVRRNQERLVTKDDNQQRPNKTAKWKDLVREEEENYQLALDPLPMETDVDEFDQELDIQGDFYDLDDEGFELDDEEDDDEFSVVGRLISPKPVGGYDRSMIPNELMRSAVAKEDERTKKAPWEASQRESNKNNQESSPGFFFNPVAATGSSKESEGDDTSDVRATKLPRREESRPILDMDGNALYLTLDQAKIFFAADTDNGGDDTHDDDDTARSWEELGITSPQLLLNLQTMKCPVPLAVQDKACPSILTGNDVLVGTYTGSGKTLAFLVPLVQRLLLLDDPSDGIQVLIVAPGRELASQIVSVARDLLAGTEMTTMLSIGGTTFARNLEQIRKRKPTILVGTPGRIAELIVGKAGEKKGRLPIASLKSIVLDEFDALLEYKPHRDPTAALVQVLKNRHRESLQSILCSATASDMMGSVKLDTFLRPGYVMAMADRYDKLVTTGSGGGGTRVSKTVLHGVVHVPQKRFALDAIRRILHTDPIPQQVLIFAENARRVDILIDKLDELGIVAAPLHGGDKSEKMDRAEVSKALREGYVGLVVATELAARGLDAPLLTHVINLDLPTDASHYAHRAGRCGRGGRPGVVINITTGPKERNVPQRFADNLGVKMHTVEVKNGRLNLVDPGSIHLDPPQDR